MKIINKANSCDAESATTTFNVTEQTQFTLSGNAVVAIRYNGAIVATLSQSSPTYIASALGEYRINVSQTCNSISVFANEVDTGSDVDQVSDCHGNDAVSVYDICVRESVDRVNETLRTINESVNNHATNVNRQLSAIGEAIGEVITTIDDGVNVTATQAGTWQVEIVNPSESTDIDELANKVAEALRGLDINIDGQTSSLDVNVLNDKLLVEIDNLPTIPYDVEVREVCMNSNNKQIKALEHVVYNEDGGVRRIYFTDHYGNEVDGEVIECYANTAIQRINGDTTVTGIGVVVTVRKGTADIAVNGGEPVNFGGEGWDGYLKQSRIHSGVVEITNLSTDADVIVEYSGSNLIEPIIDQGPLSDYNGEGWWKDTETGIVYSNGVPEGNTHVFSDDTKEYIAVYTKEDAKQYADRASTSNVTDMSTLFKRDGEFNTDISHWDVSNVTTMREMFNRGVFNRDISGWNVSNVEDMYGMFYNNKAFNQDLSEWCVAEIVERPSYFDNYADAWTEDKPQWGYCPRGENGNPTEPPKVTDQGPASEYSGTGWYKATDTGIVYNKGVPEGETHTFEGDPKEYISVYTQEDARQYAARAATSNMTDMSILFSNIGSEFNEDISHWDTSNVTNMRFMLNAAFSFNQDISNWDVSNVENMESMFTNARKFNQDLSQWCVAKISEKPRTFDYNARSWTLPKPVWGTCPRGEDQS